MDEIYCIIIVSNSHVFASKQVNISMTTLKRYQLVKRCQVVKGCQIVTPKYAMLKFVIIPLCTRYQTVDNSYWKPNIGQFM